MQAWYTPPPKKEKSKAKRVKKRQCWRRKTATSLEVHGVIEKKQALERKREREREKRRILLVEMFEVSFAILKAAVNQAVNQAAPAAAAAVVAAAAAVNHRQRKERCTMK